MLTIITSAAYVENELAAEFGRLPPAFLPVGNKRLYELQFESIRGAGAIYLTIPESYHLDEADAARIDELGIAILPVPDDLDLGESVAYAINYIGCIDEPLEILHGDTLIDDVPRGETDIVAISGSREDYAWAVADVSGDCIVNLEVVPAGAGRLDERPVLCGYFAFANARAFVQAIVRARFDFVGGLALLAAETPVRARVVSSWKDFGHILTYFDARRAITTERAFNTLDISAMVVRKKSDYETKLRAEAAWLQKLPAELRPYSVRVIDSGVDNGQFFYTTVYEPAPTLAELFVFSAIGRPMWRKILDSCRAFLTSCSAHRYGDSSEALFEALAISKTFERLERHAASGRFDVRRDTRFAGRPMPSLWRIAEEATAILRAARPIPATLMHGDFCFSNILYNSRSGRILAMDPRGWAIDGKPTLAGDARYDLAKLSHSIIGRYDHILAGRYNLTRATEYDFDLAFETSPQIQWVQRAFHEMSVVSVKADSMEVRALVICLFLSMLPLHADRIDRQVAFVANAIRLYADLDGPA